VTASALSHGSMDALLDALAPRPVILVGPTGAVLPDPFFQRGVRLVCTELRTSRYLDAYEFDEHLYQWFTEYDDRTYISSADSTRVP
jgi:hypothetical protein